MKAFFASVLACVVIGIGAHYALLSLDRTAANAGSSDFVRLN